MNLEVQFQAWMNKLKYSYSLSDDFIWNLSDGKRPSGVQVQMHDILHQVSQVPIVIEHLIRRELN